MQGVFQASFVYTFTAQITLFLPLLTFSYSRTEAYALCNVRPIQDDCIAAAFNEKFVVAPATSPAPLPSSSTSSSAYPRPEVARSTIPTPTRPTRFDFRPSPSPLFPRLASIAKSVLRRSDLGDLASTARSLITILPHLIITNRPRVVVIPRTPSSSLSSPSSSPSSPSPSSSPSSSSTPSPSWASRFRPSFYGPPVYPTPTVSSSAPTSTQTSPSM